MPHEPLYKRVLLKLSGEALMGKREYGLDNDVVRAIAVCRRLPARPGN